MKKNTIIVSCLTGLMLSACGGGSGDSSSATIEADADEIKNTAVLSLGGVYDKNTQNVAGVANRNSEVIVGTVADVTIGGTDTIQEDFNGDFAIQENLQSLFSSSLATSNSENSTTTRDGNTISIDPDENEICANEILDSSLDASELNQCTALLQDVTVELMATSEESGVITYLFQSQDVIEFGYGEQTEYSEVHLGGIRSFLSAASILIDGQELEGLPSTMTGSFRTAATIADSDGDSGTISFEITDPIQITSTTEEGTTDISLDVGNLLTIEADAEAGTGSLSFDAGAMSLMAPSDTGIAHLNLAGYTGSAVINSENNDLVVSNFGLSKGPLSISIDNTEVLSMTLEAFGFRVTEGSDLEPGRVIIDGDMNLAIIANQFGELDPESDIVSAAINMMMPGGTTMSVSPNGNTAIGGVGPLTLSYTATDIFGDEQGDSVTVNSGECFDSLLGSSSGGASASSTGFINSEGELIIVESTELIMEPVDESGVQPCE